MNELDYILDVHRRERLRSDAVCDVLLLLLGGTLYGILHALDLLP